MESQRWEEILSQEDMHKDDYLMVQQEKAAKWKKTYIIFSVAFLSSRGF